MSTLVFVARFSHLLYQMLSEDQLILLRLIHFRQTLLKRYLLGKPGKDFLNDLF